LALSLGTPVASLPTSTAISFSSQVQIVLVWTASCNVSIPSVYLYSQAGAPCTTYNCTDTQQSTPNVAPVAQLAVPVANNSF
jgi:hypothetical protein